jgi:lantibiotic transport system permease protein
MAPLIWRSISSEWLKRRRSLTTALVLGSAGFVPAIIFLSRFRRIDALPGVYANPRFWDTLWMQSWEAMAVMILPMAIMLTVTLITQIEDTNNAWKQVHATPQPLAVVYAAKLFVILVLLVELILAFTAAIYASGVLPAALFSHVAAPAAPFPLLRFLQRDAVFFIDVLPIVSLQFLLALRFRTFLTPLGLGMAMWILSVGTFGWAYKYLIPYSYAGIDYLMVEYKRQMGMPAAPPAIAAGCFFVFTVAGYVVYANRQDKS